MAKVILRDGRVAEFREARQNEADRERLSRLFAAGSDESRYLRFFRVVREVLPSDIENMLHSDGVHQFTLVCTSDNRAIGVGTYTRAGADVAEVAFFVADRDQGRGIGTLLLEHLAAIAWEYGFRRFVAGVLEENRRMQRVFQSSGYEVVTRASSGVVRMELPLYQSERTRSLMELREKHAVAASISPFLEPRAIAVVGASRDPDSLGQMMFRHIIEGSFAGTVYPVNPKAVSVASVRAYASVKEIPEPVDLAILVVPAEHTVDAAQDCIDANVHAVITVSSGFAERDKVGLDRQNTLTSRLREAGCRLIGPNSLGVVNTQEATRLNASFAPSIPKSGSLAIASQSGALGIAILEYASRSGIGVSSFVSTGNRADISSNDLLQYWEDDSHARIVALYLESFGNPRTFSRIARRISKRKPIVAVKSARSSVSQQVSDMNRTALFANDAVVDALFRQTGIIRVDTLPELFDVVALLASTPLPAGPRVAVVTNSAGGAVMAVDALEKYGLTFVSPVLDLGSEALAEGYGSVLPELLRDPAVDAVLVVFVPIGLSEQEDVQTAIADALLEAAGHGIHKPVLANFLVTSDSMVRLVDIGTTRVPVYPFPEQAARALGHVAGYAEYVRQPVGRIPDADGLNLEAVRRLLEPSLDPPLNAGEAMDGIIADVHLEAVLQALGIPVASDDSEAWVSIQGSLDPLFGPLIRLRREAPVQFAAERIAPLTDVDCAAMVAKVFPEGLLPSEQKALEQILLRASRLMDEIHAVAGFMLYVHAQQGEAGSGPVSVLALRSQIQVRSVPEVAIPYRA